MQRPAALPLPVAPSRPSRPRPHRPVVVRRRPSGSALAAAALVAAMALWGTSFVATKVVLDHVPPLTLAALRFVVALAVLLPLTLRTGRRPTLGLDAALLGLTGMALFFVCQNLGLRFASAGTAALVLNGGIPILTTLLAALLLRERLAGARLVGTVAGVGGVLALVLLGSGHGAASPGGSVAALGVGLLLLAAAAAAAAYMLLGRRAFAGGDALALTTGATGYGLLFTAPAAAAEVALVGVGRPTGTDLLLLLYLGAGCSALPFVLWGYALARLEACQVAVLGNLELLFAVAFAAILLREPLPPAHLAGGALILIGVWLAARPQRARRPDTRSAPAAAPANDPWVRSRFGNPPAPSDPKVPRARLAAG